MIKKISLIILLFCTIISCGIKSDPEYRDTEKKVVIEKIVKIKPS